MFCQQVVQSVTTDAKSVADVLALQIDILIKSLATNGGIDVMEQIRAFVFVLTLILRLFFLLGLFLGLRRRAVDHAYQCAVFLADDAFLTEEIDGEGDGQQGDDGHSETDDVGALSLGLLFLYLQLLFLGVITGGVVVSLTGMEAVADDLGKIGVARLEVEGFSDVAFGTGGYRSGA